MKNILRKFNVLNKNYSDVSILIYNQSRHYTQITNSNSSISSVVEESTFFNRFPTICTDFDELIKHKEYSVEYVRSVAELQVSSIVRMSSPFDIFNMLDTLDSAVKQYHADTLKILTLFGVFLDYPELIVHATVCSFWKDGLCIVRPSNM